MAIRHSFVFDDNKRIQEFNYENDNLFTGYGLVRVTETSADYTVLVTDDVIICDTSGGVVTITLPALSAFDFDSNEHKYFTIKRNGANNVVVVPDGSDTIQGEAQKILNVNWWGMDILATSSQWIII